MARCCDSFTRSEMLRQGVARAGQGLRPIEAGMPTPAGTGLTRRSMLLRGMGAGLSIYGASKLGVRAFDEGVAQAAGAAPAQPVLVSIFLPGGADSLSILAPVGDARYQAARPTLRLAPGGGPAFAEDPSLQWSPRVAGSLGTLHAEGKLAVATAIGYEHPDQSHFVSRHFYEVGATDAAAQQGWLGRYLDRHGTPDNPLQGMSLDGSLSPMLAAAENPVCAVASPDAYGLWAPGVGAPILDPTYAAIGQLGRVATDDPALRTARTVATQVDLLRQRLGPLQANGSTPGFTSPVAYPSGTFAHRLAALGAMLSAGLPISCVTLDAAGSFDTHSDQAATLGNDLQRTFDAVLAFQRDLEARGQANRVLTLVWSEFGRRVGENGSGTDHGAAGIGMLVGSRVRPQQLGSFPGLATLDNGNLRSSFDFRALYCSLLEQWFGVDAAPIIPGAAGFARPALLN